MLKPDPHSNENLEETELAAPYDQGPSFADLMMMVFSGPMCFECLEEVETENVEGEGEESSS